MHTSGLIPKRNKPMVSRGLNALKAGTKRGDSRAMPLIPPARPFRAPAELQRPLGDFSNGEGPWKSSTNKKKPYGIKYTGKKWKMGPLENP